MAPAVLAKLSSLAGVALLALMTAGGAAADNGGFTPIAPESPNADGIRDTFLFVSIFALLIFLLVEVALVVFVVRYRRRRRERFEEGAQIHGSTRLELLWTAVPVVILVLIAFFVFLELPRVSGTPEATAGASDEVLEVDVQP
jgi:cytochrome c oxidase subunit II